MPVSAMVEPHPPPGTTTHNRGAEVPITTGVRLDTTGQCAAQVAVSAPVAGHSTAGGDTGSACAAGQSTAVGDTGSAPD